ncbi:MAG: mannose-1-phosphate guanylyltransferase/mannose-6-phosphate isomerase, partial [Desulfobulbia bacterium]
MTPASDLDQLADISRYLGKKIHPFVFCGGSGSRLWPLSRRQYPKQFLPLVSEHSLFQETCLRLDHPTFASPVILTGNEHRFLVAEQLREIDLEPEAIVLEPVRRNTAPAALVAALIAMSRSPDTLVLLLPSDHVIREHEKFWESVLAGVQPARQGNIVTFGAKPDCPETGYGYIECESGDALIRNVKRFIEKPTVELAKEYLAAGNFCWNVGIFLFEAQTMITAFEKHAPHLLNACQPALEQAKSDFDFLRLDQSSYTEAQNISLDYAIMEKADPVKTVLLSSDWSDLGSWPAVWSMHDKDDSGNVSHGDVLLMDSSDCFAHSEEGIQLSLIGLEDVFAIATKDAIVVAPKARAQDVRNVVDKLSDQDRSEVDLHRRVYRPWGWYEGLGEGDRFQVKCIMVKSDAKLSLQSHHHRAEHWVVVKGTLEVTLGDTKKILTENESIYVPLGQVHRLANPGMLPALLIEVQSGAYLGEDDIVRYDDI